jgi:hypothetical protein
VPAPPPQLTLNWTDNSGGQAGFVVERRLEADNTFTALAQVPAGQTSYVDATVVSGASYCYRVKAINEAGESPYTAEACQSVAEALNVTVDRTGNGTVTSDPAGIDCGATCSVSYPVGAVVTLNATPASGNTFTGWSGGGCSGTGSCTVTGNVAVTVSATFAAQTFPLTVGLTGSGTVTSSPAGISCGADCSESYASGTAVTLTAAPAAGNTFTGWSGGGCSGTGTCTVSVTSALSVSATFAAQNFTLTVNRSGQGTVSGPGINCGKDCSETLPAGTVVTLTATPAANTVFEGWSGACSGTGSCTLTLTGNTTVGASFKRR